MGRDTKKVSEKETVKERIRKSRRGSGVKKDVGGQVKWRTTRQF